MYSNSVATWISGVSTSVGVKKGWRGSVWTALVTTLTEPNPDNTDWSLDTPIKIQGITILGLHKPEDYLKIRVQGVTIIDTHVNRPPEVLLQGVTLIRWRSMPSVIIN